MNVHGILIGLFCIAANMAWAQTGAGGESAAATTMPKKWKSEDGQELFEIAFADNGLSFEYMPAREDRMYGEYFRGSATRDGERYAGTASAAVAQIARGRVTRTCTIRMSVTLSSATPARIAGNVRPDRVDPDCMPNNFSATMTSPAFLWIPATEDDVPPPQIQRRIDASIQYEQRKEATARLLQLQAEPARDEVERRRSPNLHLRGCEAALANERIACSAHYPNAFPWRPYSSVWGRCRDAQVAVRTSCY